MPEWIAITPHMSIDRDELSETFMRSSGPGGQHVNTTSTAVELRFDAVASPNLPDFVKVRLTAIAGRQLTRDGVLVITAETHRSQQRNRDEALTKLVALLQRAAVRPRLRRPTRPTLGSKVRRLEGKSKRSTIKTGRRKDRDDLHD